MSANDDDVGTARTTSEVQKWRTEDNVKVLFGYILGVLALAACLYIAAHLPSPQFNVLVCISGGVVGWIVGILATPRSPAQGQQFFSYGKAISTFFGGYAVSKLNAFFPKEGALTLTSLVTSQLLLFGTAFCLGALFTFVGRDYGTAMSTMTTTSTKRTDNQGV
jgi:hypothetical protein